MTFGKKLQKERQKRKLSQNDVAKILSVSPQIISKWERNESEPTLENLIKLSLLFDITTDQLLEVSKVSISDYFSDDKNLENFYRTHRY